MELVTNLFYCPAVSRKHVLYIDYRIYYAATRTANMFIDSNLALLYPSIFLQGRQNEEEEEEKTACIMIELQDEEIQSLTTNQQSVPVYVRGQRRALCAGAICFILGLSPIVFPTATRLGPRADLVVSKEEERSSDLYRDYSLCYMGGSPSLHRANDFLELGRRAKLGLDNNSSLHHHSTTSLNETAAALTRQSAQILQVPSKDPNNLLFGVAFEFHAIDNSGNPVTAGGDEFILSLQGWSSEWSFQTAAYATDLHNGTYRAAVILPRLRVEHMNVTLMHYYTAYEGLGYDNIDSRYNKGMSFDLDHGPLMVEMPENFLDYLLTVETDDSLQTRLDARPPCQPTQEGVDQLMSGIWIEKGIPLYGELSLKAKWEPFCCRPPVEKKPNNVQFFRIGSSTMPRPSVHVGDVYDLERPFHQRWVDALLNTLPHSTVNDTVVFSAGLHQLLYGYNPETAAVLTKRMICQIAAVFPGKIIFVGPCPIQQQLFRKIDMTDQHVLLLNALLRKEILEEHNSRLDSFCSDADLDTLVSYADTATGFLLDPETTQSELARQREIIPETESERALIDKLRSTTGYANRSIYFAEIHDFLRPRPETYREGDKVHDLRQIDNDMLFVGAHSEVIEHLLILRTLGEF